MDTDTFSHEPTSSPTAEIIENMELYGPRPPEDEHDPRPLPDEAIVESSLEAMVEATVSILNDTQLESDLDEVLWSLTNIFHRRLNHIGKRLDDNEANQRESQNIQDGSEVKSVELEKLIGKGQQLIEQRDSYEMIRDLSAQLYNNQIGSVWHPRTGSKVSHRGLTASVIDSRNYISAKRRSENETHCPAGTRIALTGGLDYQDHNAIWDVLDQTKQKHTDMILLHGGGKTGAELIAAKWADNRNVDQVIFLPDWKSHSKAAPFKRNDELLKVMPIGIIACPGNGINENLVDKAKKLGIPIKRVGS